MKKIFLIICLFIFLSIGISDAKYFVIEGGSKEKREATTKTIENCVPRIIDKLDAKLRMDTVLFRVNIYPTRDFIFKVCGGDTTLACTFLPVNRDDFFPVINFYYDGLTPEIIGHELIHVFLWYMYPSMTIDEHESIAYGFDDTICN